MMIKAIRGMKDILPEEAGLWRKIEEQAAQLCEVYGYRRIRTPLLEEARLFTRSIGESSDIVRKEMYSFVDRKQRSLCLRPEGTASVIRAYLEHGLDKSTPLAKFYYLGPMFRAERPQAGRLRQFHHIGAEAIGSLSPYLDAEVIALSVNILRKIQVENFTLHLNSIGCPKDRQQYQTVLKAALTSKMRLLCTDCRQRYQVNILRIFDCKNVSCKKITQALAPIAETLCPQCAQHFLDVQQSLRALNIAYTLNPYLVRGLDYYTKTCFEITHPVLGAQNALGAGGRYDNLVRDLGGPESPACGFALGLERLLNALGQAKTEAEPKSAAGVYIAVIGEAPKEAAFNILQSLRELGIQSEMDYLSRSLKAQMRLADKLGFRYAAIIGEDELKKQVIILRDMRNQSQREIGMDKLAAELKG